MKKREAWLDSLKGFCILLVVFCHSTLLSKETVVGNVFMSLAWTAVPCFMMVTGGLLHHAAEFSWKRYLKRLAQTYLAMCVWRGIYLAVTCLVRAPAFTAADAVPYLLYLKDIDGVSSEVMWYIAAYLISMLLLPVTWHLFNRCGSSGRKALMFLAGAAFVSGILCPSADWLLTLCFGNSFSAAKFTKFLPLTNYAHLIFYFLAGAFLYEYREKITEKTGKRKNLAYALLPAGVFLLMVIKYTHAGTFGWGNVYLKNGYTRVSTVIPAVSLWFIFEMNAGRAPRMQRFLANVLGRNTLGIYYIHFLTLFVLRETVYPLIPWRNFGMNCVKTVVVTAFSVILTVLIKKIPVVKKLV